MARWLVLIICGFLVFFVLSGSACSWMVRATDKPNNNFEHSRCTERSGAGGIRKGDCLNFMVPKVMVGEKFLREKKQNARKAVA